MNSIKIFCLGIFALVVASDAQTETMVPGVSIEASFKQQSGKTSYQSTLSLISSQKETWTKETLKGGGGSSGGFGLYENSLFSDHPFFSLSLFQESPLSSILPLCNSFGLAKDSTEVILESFHLSMKKESQTRKILGFPSSLIKVTGKGILQSVRKKENHSFSVLGNFWVTDFSHVSNKTYPFLLKLGATSAKKGFPLFNKNETEFCGVGEKDHQTFDEEFRRIFGKIGGLVLSSEIILKENQKPDQVFQLEITKIETKEVPGENKDLAPQLLGRKFGFQSRKEPKEKKYQTLSEELNQHLKNLQQTVKKEIDQKFSKICEMEKNYYKKHQEFKSLEAYPMAIPGLLPIHVQNCLPTSNQKNCNDWVGEGIFENQELLFCQYSVDSSQKEKPKSFEARALCDLNGDGSLSKQVLKGSLDLKTQTIQCKRK